MTQRGQVPRKIQVAAEGGKSARAREDRPSARGTELAGTSWKTLANFSPAELNYALLKHPDYKMLFADVFYRTCLKPGGALTVEKATERFRARCKSGTEWSAMDEATVDL